MIATLRRQAVMSQGQLAQAMATHRTHISRIESGRVLPSLTTLECAAKALGTALGELALRIEIANPR